MDYKLDVFLLEDEEHPIEFTYEQLVEKAPQGNSFLSMGAPAKEWIQHTNTYKTPMYAITLTPYHDIISKVKRVNASKPSSIPVFVEYDEVKALKQATLISASGNVSDRNAENSYIIWEEYGDEDKRGEYPTVNMQEVRRIAGKAIAEFKRTNEHNIIAPGMNCELIWETPEDFQKAVN